MRTKRMAMFLLSTIVMILMALLLSSCSLLGGGGGEEGSGSSGSGGSGGKTTKDEGWKTVENPQIYNALVLGCTNVAYQGSKQAIVANKGALTVDSKIKFTLQDTSIWVIVKAKYKSDSPKESTMVSIDLSTEETPSPGSRVASVYLYKDELYFALGNDSSDPQSNKVKFSIKNVPWQKYFPYAMEKLTTEDIKKLSAVLISGVKTNKANKAEFRRSENGDEYRYALDIDLDATITQIFESISSAGNDVMSLDIVKKMKEFVAVFYSVSESDITAGKLPKSSLLVNFQTLNGIISSMDFKFDIDLSEKTKLFGDGKMKGSASVVDLSISNNYASLKIPFVSDLEGMTNYVDFGDIIFTLKLPMEEYKETGLKRSQLKITTKVFQGEGDKDFLFAEYSDTDEQQVKRGVYIYNNNMYFYSRENEEYKCIKYLDILDAGQLAKDVVGNNMSGSSEFDPVKLFAYIINGLSIDTNGIRFSVKPNFYTDVWFNFNDLCDYINSYTVEDIFEQEEMRNFYNFVLTNEIIFTMGTHDPFFEVLTSSSSAIRDVMSILDNAPEEAKLTLAK